MSWSARHSSGRVLVQSRSREWLVWWERCSPNAPRYQSRVTAVPGCQTVLVSVGRRIGDYGRRDGRATLLHISWLDRSSEGPRTDASVRTADCGARQGKIGCAGAL